jgi:hypothetical protein
MTESAGASGAALDATVVTGSSASGSRLERAATAWESAVDLVARMTRKVAKLQAQLDDAARALSEARQAQITAQAEFDSAQSEIGGTS